MCPYIPVCPLYPATEKRGNTCSFMCCIKKEGHHLCVIMGHWRTGLWRGMWHLTLPTGANCFTTMALTNICVSTLCSLCQSKILCAWMCVCAWVWVRVGEGGERRGRCHYHTSGSHWSPPSAEHACRILLTSRTIWKCLCLPVVWELFSESLVMIPSCWWFIRGSSTQFMLLSSFLGEGQSHTLHSLARNLITHKGSTAHLSFQF